MAAGSKEGTVDNPFSFKKFIAKDRNEEKKSPTLRATRKKKKKSSDGAGADNSGQSGDVLFPEVAEGRKYMNNIIMMYWTLFSKPLF